MYSIIRTNFLLCYINFNLRRLQSSLHVYNKFYEIKIYRIFPEILKNRLHNIFLEYFILLSNFREKIHQVQGRKKLANDIQTRPPTILNKFLRQFCYWCFKADSTKFVCFIGPMPFTVIKKRVS